MARGDKHDRRKAAEASAFFGERLRVEESAPLAEPVDVAQAAPADPAQERPSFDALFAAATKGGFAEVSTVSVTSAGHSSGGVRVTASPRRVDLSVVLARSKAHLEHLANDTAINLRIVE